MFAQPRVKKSLLPPPKKRKIEHAIEEVNYDDAARTEFLTGFHKRKQARIKHAQEIAEKKARQDRLEFRKQVREDRKQAIEDHVNAVQKLLREAQEAGQDEDLQNGSEDEWAGIPDEVPQEPPLDREEEYIDEDRYTTVTVEAVNIDRDGIHKPVLKSEEEDKQREGDSEGIDPEEAAGSEKTGKRVPDHPKKKKKKFRYETKFERQLAERKQKAKKAAKR